MLAAAVDDPIRTALVNPVTSMFTDESAVAVTFTVPVLLTVNSRDGVVPPAACLSMLKLSADPENVMLSYPPMSNPQEENAVLACVYVLLIVFDAMYKPL